MSYPGLRVPSLFLVEKPSTKTTINAWNYVKDYQNDSYGSYRITSCSLNDGKSTIYGERAVYDLYPGNSYKLTYGYFFTPNGEINGIRDSDTFYIQCQYKSTTPSISGVDSSLGSKSKGFDINYTITNEDSYTYTVRAYLNDTLFDTKQAVKDTQYTINVPDSLVFALQLNSNNKLKIEVTGGYGISAIYRNYTFIKSNNPPTISGINEDIGNKSRGFSLKYIVNDLDYQDTVNVTIKLNSIILENITNIEKNREKELILTDDYILALPIDSTNNISIIATDNNGISITRTYTFTRTNNLPTIKLNEISTNKVKYIVSDLDSNLNKIEVFLDNVLKETITTDLYLEKTYNYTLNDSAIHTVKIKATDMHGLSEKLISVSKEIQPPQDDSSLQEIESTVSTMKNTFINSKTHIINKLVLKNINATLNNTLIEMGEMIGTAFSSADASVQDLQSQLTEKNNTITQLNGTISNLQEEVNSRLKIYTFSGYIETGDSNNFGGYGNSRGHWYFPLPFKPKFFLVTGVPGTLPGNSYKPAKVEGAYNSLTEMRYAYINNSDSSVYFSSLVSDQAISLGQNIFHAYISTKTIYTYYTTITVYAIG
ncbi:hypothetical protein Semix9P1_phi32 [Clostridioides phage phiSemix9P1]|uniref:hypothetical protein n=1 Tax=unclassified Clostridioides TaxID=2635829 RepID=UPI0009C2EF77|nr:hypothetical protein Semix9P1_phi32 [Clostridioides phage phiSemix9P1]MCC0646129.1 hypothetical protein [Clostridioides sp. ZZV14-6150]MCC0724017.1 hypothetical protein [Clostridioides sp. ZZV14-6104]MCC0724848.1 hypothetical protein [Clostridioides sp. ZZV14-6045]MCC0732294.1 hypothetical protein [Clostridioides sp. ZZV14-6048]MCC0736431.1 hypothetical protein [Clostridioides sp. ZZV14-6009]MCC0740154.1 hypothetical protein [Clostridioides sp. ZZV14-5902]MCC0744170.1 hypothetical protein